MEVITGLIAAEFWHSYSQEAPLSQTTWVELGEQTFIMARESDWQQIGREMRRVAVPLRQNPRRVQEEKLYLVVQKGRIFQQENPDVPVLADRGRFLVVELEPQKMASLERGDEPCYVIRPLRDYPVVFRIVPRGDERLIRTPEIENLVKQVRRETIEPILEKLVSFPTRFSTSQSYGEAAIWTQEKLQCLGYETRFEPIPVGNENSQNVISERSGRGAEDTRELIIVTAHLDSINDHQGASASAPGADDNGSGSAGLMEIARVLQNYQHQHDLQLILFGGEEQGLFGSKEYVSTLSARDRSRLKAVLNMDMIGSLNTATPTVMLEGAALSQAVIDSLARTAAAYTALSVQTSLNPFASDHVPFINAGLPAVLTIEGTDSANTAIHSARDTVERISYDLMREILRMNVAFIASSLM